MSQHGHPECFNATLYGKTSVCYSVVMMQESEAFSSNQRSASGI